MSGIARGRRQGRPGQFVSQREEEDLRLKNRLFQLVRRLCPLAREKIDVKHRGKLRISLVGGIGDQWDPE